MKQISIVLLLSGLCILSSCGKTENTAKDIAGMKACQELVFLHNDKSGTIFAKITEREKIDKVLHAIQYSEPYAPALPPLLAYSIRGVGKNGATKQAKFTWSDDAKAVLFSNSRSKEVYQLFVEYGIIDPSVPAVIGHPDLKSDEASERLEN
jgi:hypothetical protein